MVEAGKALSDPHTATPPWASPNPSPGDTPTHFWNTREDGDSITALPIPDLPFHRKIPPDVQPDP